MCGQFPERERGRLVAWRQEAVRRERRRAERKTEQLQQMRSDLMAELEVGVAYACEPRLSIWRVGVTLSIKMMFGVFGR